MKRSSHRRAIRWILQELTRWLEQHNGPLRDQTRSVEGKPDAARKSRHGVDQKGRPALLRQITAELNAKGIKTARGKKWSAMQVKRVMARV